MPTAIENLATDLQLHARTYNPQIQQTLRQGLEFERDLAPRGTDKRYVSPNVTTSEVLQQYQWAFTPNNNVTFDEVATDLQQIKIDIVFKKEELQVWWESWRLEWYDVGLREEQYSFPNWLYQKVLMPQIIQEINLNSWNGQYVPPTEGVAGISINTVDGFRKKINDAVAGGKVTELATGPLVQDTMVDQLESWCDNMPAVYRDAPGVIKMSTSNALKYWRGYRGEFGTGNGVAGNQNNELRIDATNKIIKGYNCMEGSDRIIFNPSVTRNMFWLTKSGIPTYPSLRWFYDVRCVKATAEFYRGYGFDYWGHLYTNDQD